MAEKFFAEPGRVRELRNKLQLKQTAFEGVSDRIVRDMEAGKPVSIRSAHKVAKCLGVPVEKLKAKSVGSTVQVPEIDIRLDGVRHMFVSPAYPVAAPELGGMLEASRDVRFLTYGHLLIDGPRREALQSLESAVKSLRESQTHGKRTTMLAESITQMIEQRTKTEDLQEAIEELSQRGISLFATNVINKDWYQDFDPYEDAIPPDVDPANVRKLRTWEVTVFIFSGADQDCINVIASDQSRSTVLEPPPGFEFVDEDTVPF